MCLIVHLVSICQLDRRLSSSLAAPTRRHRRLSLLASESPLAVAGHPLGLVMWTQLLAVSVAVALFVWSIRARRLPGIRGVYHPAEFVPVLGAALSVLHNFSRHHDWKTELLQRAVADGKELLCWSMVAAPAYVEVCSTRMVEFMLKVRSNTLTRGGGTGSQQSELSGPSLSLLVSSLRLYCSQDKFDNFESQLPERRHTRNESAGDERACDSSSSVSLRCRCCVFQRARCSKRSSCLCSAKASSTRMGPPGSHSARSLLTCSPLAS